jgi:hypothetical protein
VIETTNLQFGTFTLEDMSNVGAEKFLPLSLFFLIFGLGACFDFETGYAMNFARDFGPQLMSYMVGYGPKVWTAGHYYFWVPIVAPFIRCTFGVSCTTYSYAPARAQSARLGWVRKGSSDLTKPRKLTTNTVYVKKIRLLYFWFLVHTEIEFA